MDTSSFLGDLDMLLDDFDLDRMDSLIEFQNKEQVSVYDINVDLECVDRFLNLDKPCPNGTGITVDKKCHSAQVEDCALSTTESNMLKAKVVKADHEYARSAPMSYEFANETSITSIEVPQDSPNNMSDSGVSSISGSPQYDRSGNSSPVTLKVHTNDSAQSVDDKSIYISGFQTKDDCQFDFSDIDMEQLTVSHANYDDVDLASLFAVEPLQQVTLDMMNRSEGGSVYGNNSESSDSCTESFLSPDGWTANNNSASNLKKNGKQKLSVCIDLPNFKPLILTDEEKKLLNEEGVTIPTDLPLTKYEERVLKKVRRKIRNKKSAMVSRQKKKDYVGGLEARVTQCTNLNQTLAQRVKELEQQNVNLMEQLRKIHDMVKGTSSKTTQATTCILVLVMSFGLFIAPNIGPFSPNPRDTDVVEISEGHITRKVLQHSVSMTDVKKFNPKNVIGPNEINHRSTLIKPDVDSPVMPNDRTLTISQTFKGVAPEGNLQHENASLENSSSSSMKDADLAVPVIADNADTTSSLTPHASLPTNSKIRFVPSKPDKPRSIDSDHVGLKKTASLDSHARSGDEM